MEKSKKELYQTVMNTYDYAHNLMSKYDSLPHIYGEYTLYAQEAYFISAIGDTPGTTITALAKAFHKTPSACSQMVKRLLERGWIRQERNADNKRFYNLYLTEDGEKLVATHKAFNVLRRDQIYEGLKEFSEDEYEIYLKIQNKINDILIDAIENPALTVQR